MIVSYTITVDEQFSAVQRSSRQPAAPTLLPHPQPNLLPRVARQPRNVARRWVIRANRLIGGSVVATVGVVRIDR